MVRYLRKYPDQIDVISANPVRKVRSTGEVYENAAVDLGRFRYGRLEDACAFEPDGLFESALGGSPLTTQTIVMRRALLDRVRFDEDLLAGEDILFHLELAHCRAKVAHLPRVHVTYWAHGGNLTCAAGLGDVRSKLPLFLAYAQMAIKVPEKFDLSPAERAGFRGWLADLYFWYIGYSIYFKHGDPARARQYFLKAIRIKPWKPSFWKTFLLSYLTRAAPAEPP
jgi:hypothetical protein